MKKILSILLLTICFTLPTWATRPITPPTEADMTHAWFGYDNHRNFLRLDLKSDGTGTLVWLQLGGESPTVFDIPKWEWNGPKWKLNFSVKTRRPDDENIWLRVGNAGWDEVEISFGDKAAKWDREAKLMNERKILENLKAAAVE